VITPPSLVISRICQGFGFTLPNFRKPAPLTIWEHHWPERIYPK